MHPEETAYPVCRFSGGPVDAHHFNLPLHAGHVFELVRIHLDSDD
jgi:hypothetical protein